MVESTVGQTFRIAIIGGGLAGLSLAIALKRKGFENLTVYEREKSADVRHQGWSISLFSPDGGLGFLENLGLSDEFARISFQPCFRAIDGETGKTLLHKVGSSGNGRRYKRGDLRHALEQVATREGVRVVWDAQVERFEEIRDEVLVHFVNAAQNPTVAVDLLIGADGVHSPIRAQLTGDRVHPAGFNAVVGLIEKESDGRNDDLFEHELIKNTGALVCGRNATCWYAHQVLHDEIYWSLCIRCDENYIRERTNYDKGQLHSLATEISQKFFPLIQELVARTPVEQMQDCLLFKDLDPLQRHPSNRFCVSRTGRVTLVGDAAHAMIPFRGQGGNTALMGCWNLSDQLAELTNKTAVTNDDINHALERYENERIPVGSRELLNSRESSEVFHSASSFKIFVRNSIMRLVNFKMQRDERRNK